MDAFEQLAQGCWFLKYGRQGKPQRRVLWVLDAGDEVGLALAWADGMGKKPSKTYPLSDFSAVLTSLQTSTFARIHPKLTRLSPLSGGVGAPVVSADLTPKEHDLMARAFSLWGPGRTVDLVAESREDAASWVRWLCLLLEVTPTVPGEGECHEGLPSQGEAEVSGEA